MASLKTFTDANYFAFKAHEGQLRKGALKLPYICHPLEVVNILARVGYVVDYKVLSAAVLHDVVEDCNADILTILDEFGRRVTLLVNELTFINLTKTEKIARAGLLSPEACAIKIADLISNINGITEDPTAMDNADALRYVKYAQGMFNAFIYKDNKELNRLFALAVNRFNDKFNPNNNLL